MRSNATKVKHFAPALTDGTDHTAGLLALASAVSDPFLPSGLHSDDEVTRRRALLTLRGRLAA